MQRTILGDPVRRYSATEWLAVPRALSIDDTSGEGWTLIIHEREAALSLICRAEDGGLSPQSTTEEYSAGEENTLSVIAVPRAVPRP